MEGLTKTNSPIPHRKGVTWLVGGRSMQSWRINSRQLKFLSLCSPKSSSNSSKPIPTFVPTSNSAILSFFRLKQKNSKLVIPEGNKPYPQNSNFVFLTRATKQSLGDEVRSRPTEDKYALRPLADFPPSGWGDYFVSYPLSTIEESSNQRIEELKNEVKAMFKNFNNGTQNYAKTLLRLIDDLQRLGIAYHFEEEINESLTLIQDDVDEVCDDIEVVALRFSLLRQHGHNISSDAFKEFKDQEGNFKVELSLDMKSLLYLYEASFLGMREEEILDVAFNFCKGHMEQHVMVQANTNDNNVLAMKIKRALEIPFFRRLRRLEARHSIESYGKDKASNPVLLELAMLDFNLVQSLHQAEVKAISIWWQEMGISENLSFARERVVECYFWSLGVHWEPRYSKGRVLLAKLLYLSTVMDDFFDAYGTFEELKLFRDMVQRWDLEAMDRLSGNARVFANFFKSVIDEIKDAVSKKGMPLHHHQVIEECYKGYVEGFFVEATWAREGYIPAFKEYMQISTFVSAYPLLFCIVPMLNGEEMSTDVLEWILKVPTIVEAARDVGRLADDLASTQFEQQRMHVASSVQSYMNEYGVTEQEARIELNKVATNAWRDMNKGLTDPCPLKKHINMLALDFSRMAELVYKYEDSFTNPSGEMKKNIASLLVRPIQNTIN